MIRVLTIIILMAICAPALAKDKKIQDMPPSLPGTFKSALGQIGVVPGAVRTFPEGTFRLEQMKVEARGKWLVVRILPQRVYPVVP
jgi:hypothetical protein